MQVKYVFVFYCVVPLLLHVADSHEYCNFGGIKNQLAFCTSRDVQRELSHIPSISHRITDINLTGRPLKQLPRNAFQNISRSDDLTRIFLGYCQIQHVHADAFENLDSLKYLYMHDNNISRFETGTFQHTKQLISLVVEYNKIDVLQTGLFHNLVYLTEIRFQKNRITRIDIDTFRNTPSLRYIDVQYNELEYLSPLFTDNFVNLTQLLVGDNPWNCDCNLRELYEKSKLRKPTVSEPIAVCQSPPALGGRQWLHLNSDEFKCDEPVILPTNDTNLVTPGSNVTLPGNGSSTDQDNAQTSTVQGERRTQNTFVQFMRNQFKLTINKYILHKFFDK